ncbi:hypothetical protein FF2_045838 [Malus domestica]
MGNSKKKKRTPIECLRHAPATQAPPTKPRQVFAHSHKTEAIFLTHLQGRLSAPWGEFFKTLSATQLNYFIKILVSQQHYRGTCKKVLGSSEASNARTLSSLKSHDYHVLLQWLFLIGIRPYLDHDVVETVVYLSQFF